MSRLSDEVILKDVIEKLEALNEGLNRDQAGKAWSKADERLLKRTLDEAMPRDVVIHENDQVHASGFEGRVFDAEKTGFLEHSDEGGDEAKKNAVLLASLLKKSKLLQHVSAENVGGMWQAVFELAVMEPDGRRVYQFAALGMITDRDVFGFNAEVMAATL